LLTLFEGLFTYLALFYPFIVLEIIIVELLLRKADDLLFREPFSNPQIKVRKVIVNLLA
jgi:hypothetical protein